SPVCEMERTPHGATRRVEELELERQRGWLRPDLLWHRVVHEHLHECSHLRGQSVVNRGEVLVVAIRGLSEGIVWKLIAVLVYGRVHGVGEPRHKWQPVMAAAKMPTSDAKPPQKRCHQEPKAWRLHRHRHRLRGGRSASRGSRSRTASRRRESGC